MGDAAFMCRSGARWKAHATGPCTDLIWLPRIRKRNYVSRYARTNAVYATRLLTPHPSRLSSKTLAHRSLLARPRILHPSRTAASSLPASPSLSAQSRSSDAIYQSQPRAVSTARRSWRISVFRRDDISHGPTPCACVTAWTRAISDLAFLHAGLPAGVPPLQVRSERAIPC